MNQKKIELTPSEMREVSTKRSWEDPTEINCPLGGTLTCPDGYVSVEAITMWEGTDIGLKCKNVSKNNDWSLLDNNSGTIGDSGTDGSGTTGNETKDIYCKGCTPQHQIRPEGGYTNNSTQACKGYPIGSFCYVIYAGSVHSGICKYDIGEIKCKI